MGLPIVILNSFPFSVKSGHSPQVAPTDSLVSSTTHSISSATNSSSIVPEQSPSVPIESVPLSLPVSNPTTVRNILASSIHPMLTRSKAQELSLTSPHALVSSLEPNSIQETLLDCNWVKAMEEEYFALKRTNTWDLVPFSPDMNLIDCKWVFRVKYKFDGSFLKYKDWLVVKGFLQTSGIDFAETFSPVFKAPTIRVLFSLAVTFGWEIQQVDVNNAFFNGDLNEIVFRSNQRDLLISLFLLMCVG